MKFNLIGLDADDTLWQNEVYYQQGRNLFDEVMAKYQPTEADYAKLEDIEVANLKYFGYGAVGFAVSMVEAAIDISEGSVGAADLKRLLDVAKDIISAEVELIDGAEEAVRTLADRYPVLLVTKGDLLHQQAKVDQSGLKEHFRSVEVVSEKSPAIYQGLLDKFAIQPGEFIMVGNSMRSDVQPVLDIGGWAIHLTQHKTWQFEQEPLVERSGDRFHEVETIAQVPQLIHSLASSVAN